MKIYKVTQGRDLVHNVGIYTLPTVTYYHSYVDALKERGEHGGEMIKYGDCHSDVHNYRETWVERDIPTAFDGIVELDDSARRMETEIELVEVQ